VAGSMCADVRGACLRMGASLALHACAGRNLALRHLACSSLMYLLNVWHLSLLCRLWAIVDPDQ
jgi:hypothetical protein